MSNVPVEGCFKRINACKLDDEVWKRVWGLVSDPVAIGRAIDIRIAQIQAEEIDAETECKRFKHELEELVMERQKVIT
jgi:hypothetical protein